MSLLIYHCNYVSISYRFWDTQRQIMACLWNLGYRSFTVIENGTIQKLGYGSLFTFHSNNGPSFSRFDTVRERDGHPASQTDTTRRHRLRLRPASRGKTWGLANIFGRIELLVFVYCWRNDCAKSTFSTHLALLVFRCLHGTAPL